MFKNDDIPLDSHILLLLNNILLKINKVYDEKRVVKSAFASNRKRLPYFILYLHMNNVNGKFYIGQTCNPSERWGRSGIKYRYLDARTEFWPAILKYGWNNFTHYILDFVETQEEANEKERFYIERLDAMNNAVGYNIRPGGDNYMSELWQDPEYRKKATASFKKARKKLWSDPEIAIKLQSKMQMGVQAFWNNPEKRAKRIDNIKGSKNPNSKAVINLETGKIFSTISEATKWAGINGVSCIGANCRGWVKSAGKHPETGEKLHWRYLKEGELEIESEQSGNHN